jgi:dUTPase
MFNIRVDHLAVVNSYSFSASKFSISSGAGVIDADYRGIVFVLLFNLSDNDFDGDDRLCISEAKLL